MKIYILPILLFGLSGLISGCADKPSGAMVQSVAETCKAQNLVANVRLQGSANYIECVKPVK